MFLQHEKKIIILTGGAFIALCLIIFVLIVPTIHHIDTLNSDIFNMQHDLELRYERTSNLRKSKTNLGKVKQLTSELQTLFIAAAHELDFIVYLEQIAHQHNLSQSISLTDKKTMPQAQLTALNTQIQMSGSYTDALYFLRDIENAPLALRITNITLTQGGPVASFTSSASPSNNAVTLSAQVTAYVKP